MRTYAHNFGNAHVRAHYLTCIDRTVCARPVRRPPGVVHSGLPEAPAQGGCVSTDETVDRPDRLFGAKPTGRVGTTLLVCPQCHAATETDGQPGPCTFCQAVIVA